MEWNLPLVGVVFGRVWKQLRRVWTADRRAVVRVLGRSVYVPAAVEWGFFPIILQLNPLHGEPAASRNLVVTLVHDKTEEIWSKSSSDQAAVTDRDMWMRHLHEPEGTETQDILIVQNQPVVRKQKVKYTTVRGLVYATDYLLAGYRPTLETRIKSIVENNSQQMVWPLMGHSVSKQPNVKKNLQLQFGILFEKET